MTSIVCYQRTFNKFNKRITTIGDGSIGRSGGNNFLTGLHVKSAAIPIFLLHS